MCCLFGVLDPYHTFQGKTLSKIVHTLSVAAEVRGTDAAGIAYNTGGHLQIYKRPLAAHRLRFRIPNDTRVVMGHTRMTTQGDEKRNYNNHPFLGHAGNTSYALAHNGILWNDISLREEQELPLTHIQTDSYIAVQLIDQTKALNFSSLKSMAEAVEGSFCFTVLDQRDRMFFIKGDNPLCLYHWHSSGVYLYASTEEILKSALAELRLPLGRPARIELDCGDILCIDRDGRQSRGGFDPSKLLACQRFYFYPPYALHFEQPTCSSALNNAYLHDMKQVARCYGIEPETIDELLRDGFTFDELEELIYAGEI